MKVTKSHCRMFEVVSTQKWFTNIELAEHAEVALGTAQKFTRYMDKIRIVDRIESHPEPIFRLSQGTPSEEGARFLETLKRLSQALAS